MNRDPSGENGGLNLYGFVNNSPSNNLDVLGMYQEAGHFYTAYAVAIASGEYSRSQAFAFAYYTQLPDEVSVLDAIAVSEGGFPPMGAG